MRPAGLYVLALAIQLVWMQTVRQPFDWDSASYRAVALHLLHGDGAVTGALWNLLVKPPLPMPADLYWMPLPSRILVPALALGMQGDQMLNAALGALLAPLAWGLMRVRAPERPSLALAAGILAATGGMYARFLVSADSVALFGVLGAAGFLATAKKQAALAAFCAVLAAWTRNDGFLLGLAFGLGLWAESRSARALAPVLGGLGTWLVWQLRNASLVEDWWSTRATLANILELSQLIRGTAPAVNLGERLRFAMHSLPPTAAMVGLLVLPFPAIFRMGGGGWMRGVQAYALGLPVAGYLLAPAVFAEGSFFRSSVALYAVACGLAVEGWAGLQTSRYHPAFLPTLAGFGVLGLQYAVGGSPRPAAFTIADCAPLQQLPEKTIVFSNHPPLVEALCGRPSVILPAGLEPGEVTVLATRYQIPAALIAGQTGPGGAPDPGQYLPGWIFRGGLWWAPTSQPVPTTRSPSTP